MQPICTHKIGRHSSKPSHAYPVIRLPREFNSLAGRIAHVYQTQNNGKLAFVITVDEKVGNQVATNDVDSRISELESKTDTILKFLEANNCAGYPISKNELSTLTENAACQGGRSFGRASPLRVRCILCNARA
jgi:hypothetical protein